MTSNLKYDSSTIEKIFELRKLLEGAPPNSVVFFGGAGMSTMSGIPDFRSSKGLFNQKFSIPAEEVLSRSFFNKHPEEFFKFHFEYIVNPDAQPNAAHAKLAELEKRGILS